MSTESPTPNGKRLDVKPPADTAAGLAPAGMAVPDTYAPSDPRAAAAQRAAELREHWGGDQPTDVDKFTIDPAIVPDGWGYEWRMISVLGKQDPTYAVNLRQSGWDPVPTGRHPEMMPTGWPSGEQIVHDGLGLFERPLEIIHIATMRDKRAASDQLRQKEAQLASAPPGTFDRVDANNRSTVKINKTREPSMLVPK